MQDARMNSQETMQDARKRKTSEESCSLMQDLPPGFRFRPTDQQLISYYLYNKLTSKSFFLGDHKDIREYDLYGSTEPWQIWDMFGGPQKEEEEEEEEELDLYFFTTLKKVNSKGSNFIRKVGTGSWQGEAKPKKIYAFDGSKNCVGSMRRFRYENKNIPLQHGGWLMHEFNLEGSTLPSSSSNPLPCDIVLCRFRKKRNDKTQKTQEFPDNKVNNIPESSSLVPSSSSMQDEAGEVPSSSSMQDLMQDMAGEIVSGGDELSSDNNWAQSFAQDLLNHQIVCASQEIFMIPNTFYVS